MWLSTAHAELRAGRSEPALGEALCIRPPRCAVDPTCANRADGPFGGRRAAIWRPQHDSRKAAGAGLVLRAHDAAGPWKPTKPFCRFDETDVQQRSAIR